MWQLGTQGSVPGPLLFSAFILFLPVFLSIASPLPWLNCCNFHLSSDSFSYTRPLLWALDTSISIYLLDIPLKLNMSRTEIFILPPPPSLNLILCLLHLHGTKIYLVAQDKNLGDTIDFSLSFMYLHLKILYQVLPVLSSQYLMNLSTYLHLHTPPWPLATSSLTWMTGPIP